MRDNVSSNIDTRSNKGPDSIICKQLRWGLNVDKFLDQISSNTGFDVVMVSVVDNINDHLFLLCSFL